MLMAVGFSLAAAAYVWAALLLARSGVPRQPA